MKNSTVEVINYRQVDGKIILPFLVNGEEMEFVLDLAGQVALLPEYLEKLKINPEDQNGITGSPSFLYKKVATRGKVKIASISMGNSAFGYDVPAFILEDEPYLRELGVAGTVNASLFRNLVLTLDARRKKITVSSPYRPDYMRLDYRVDIQPEKEMAFRCPVEINGKAYSLLLDTWSDGLVVMNAADFTGFNGAAAGYVETGIGYGKSQSTAPIKDAGSLQIVRTKIEDATVVENTSLPYSVLGTELLNHGLLSLDFERSKLYFQPFDLVVIEDRLEKQETVIQPGKLNPINREYFTEHIYDYRKSKEFIFKGDKPVVIDFWATWCGPCMQMMPEMEKLAEKYAGKVIFLKVDADKEKELCNFLNVQALPTLLFIPIGGEPLFEMAPQTDKIERIIREKLLGE